jgi:ubiquitin carboxyl-terminal hydrolase 14
MGVTCTVIFGGIIVKVCAELFAIVTHKGRDADSGHYIGWVRKNQADTSADRNAWLVFDDETVSEVDTDYVTSHLKGGGDDHMAYLLFYKAKA